MQLAINYSSPTAQLFQAGKISFDYFKAPDWEWLVDEAKTLRPVAVHFTLDAGNAALGEADWDSVEHLAKNTATPYINLHLDSRREHFPGIPIDTTEPSDIKHLFSVMISDVLSVVERFGSDRVIIENSPYRREAGNTLRPCVEPMVISRIVNETGCGFLLDISHAFISAHYMGIDTKEYISHLPVQHVRELHFAGIHNLNDLLTDHLSIQEQDWHNLDWVLARIRSGEWSLPWMLAFEYGGVGPEFEWRTDHAVIADQVPRLLERLKLPGL